MDSYLLVNNNAYPYVDFLRILCMRFTDLVDFHRFNIYNYVY